ncbi:putative cobaltochelatase [Caldanaerobacter subterraneus]|uniref:Mg-protoporphyrin IX chelatase n=1 Tax=Caldanaerobacter subterraneus TaxID=911092 RepID=A0A7Y2L632_9THEO|nr:putative cobaltochelatase [Caldanaerobacter subterraneus]NNG66462.1 putative cobaltochelatase [Caldanaerobacter subterraneus]
MQYPFTAIVGQELMKKALILNAINPKIGGVLIRGEKGTAKSTAVRALAELLPQIKVVDGCPFNCNPDDPREMCPYCIEKWERGEKLPVAYRRMKVVDLPISATEDRVVGTIDIEAAIKKGEKTFEPGILAEANRGILYVDEVNLLDDQIVDILLDSAAMGINIVEREGVSFTHPANFILVGTMNPEEGELRPQLLDRFGLSVTVQSEKDPEARVEIIKNRLEFEKNPEEFTKKWEPRQKELRDKIQKAKELLPKISIKEELVELIARICTEMGVDGHRADITMVKTAVTIAAYKGRTEVEEEDVKEAAELVLPHRMRKKPFQQPEIDQQKLNQILNQTKKPSKNSTSLSQRPRESTEQKQQGEKQQKSEDDEEAPGTKEQKAPIGEIFTVKPIKLHQDRIKRTKGRGRRAKTLLKAKRGRYVKSRIWAGSTDIAFDATLRAAAPFQKLRRREGVAVAIEKWDIKEKIRQKKIGNLIIFVVDGSGSMNADERMKAAKGAVISLLMDAYQKRDRIALVVFKGNTAYTVLPPTSSVELAYKLMEELPTGGRTPLAEGLKKALELIEIEEAKNPDTYPLLILISDGRANAAGSGKNPIQEAEEVACLIKEKGIKSLVIDVEKDGFMNFGLARKIAERMGAQYAKIEDLKEQKIIEAVKDFVGG